MIAPAYGDNASQVARAEFFKILIADRKDWIGISDKADKVMDYGSATGILSFVCVSRGDVNPGQALIPVCVLGSSSARPTHRWDRQVAGHV